MHESAEDLPAYAEAPIAAPDRPSPVAALWRGVIEMALRDASNPLYTSSVIERKATLSRARDWLLNDGGNFRFVCLMAGIDPDVMRSRARAVLQ